MGDAGIRVLITTGRRVSLREVSEHLDRLDRSTRYLRVVDSESTETDASRWMFPAFSVRDIRIGSVEVVLAAVGSSAVALPALSKFLTMLRDWSVDNKTKKAQLRSEEAKADIAELDAAERRERAIFQKLENTESLWQRIDDLNAELHSAGLSDVRILYSANLHSSSRTSPTDLDNLDRLGASIQSVEEIDLAE